MKDFPTYYAVTKYHSENMSQTKIVNSQFIKEIQTLAIETLKVEKLSSREIVYNLCCQTTENHYYFRCQPDSSSGLTRCALALLEQDQTLNIFYVGTKRNRL